MAQVWTKSEYWNSTKSKICVPRLVEHLHAALDQEGNHFLDNVDVGGLTLKQDYEHQGLLYVLGLLNSRLLRWYFPHVSAPFRGGWRSANRQFLSQLPFSAIDFASRADVAQHDKMVRLVERMLQLHKDKQAARSETERERIEREIRVTDEQIDKLVYALYDLTPDEIAIVQGQKTGN